jgi:iron complex transport system ATP-binding protein
MKNGTLQARNLSLSYGTRDQSVIVGLDIKVEPSRITALVGPNGCGKSTLLRGLARILSPATGAVLLDGEPIHRLPTRELAKQIGTLPQAPVAPEGISVTGLVSLGRYPYQHWWQQQTRNDRLVVQRSIATAGLSSFAGTAVDVLSGGQKQRAWIAMALAQDAPIMLLDEPTTFLDIAHQVEVLDLQWDLNQNQDRTIVMVLHDLNQACRYAHKLVMLQEGQLIAQGTPHEIMQEDLIRKVFGLECRVIADPITQTPLCLPIGKREGRTSGVHSQASL